MKKYKMLFAGESWLTHNMEVKGWDDFSVGGYGTEIDRIHAAMDEFAEITHLPSHLVGEKFPSTMEELKTYDVVILSDVGANTLLLHPLVFTQSVRFPNRLQLLADYVEQGGALGMMGGYMTFQGIGGKGQVAGGQGVDAVSAVGVRLAAVLIIKAGAVDDDIRAVGIRKGADFGGDSHIHFRHIGGDQLVFFAVKPCTQRLTKMAVGTADPNFEHCCFPPSGTGQ